MGVRNDYFPTYALTQRYWCCVHLCPFDGSTSDRGARPAPFGRYRYRVGVGVRVFLFLRQAVFGSRSATAAVLAVSEFLKFHAFVRLEMHGAIEIFVIDCGTRLNIWASHS